MSSRSRKVKVSPSLAICQLCARSGMMVLPPSRGSCRIRLSNMHPIAPRLKKVPDWWRSKCGGRTGITHAHHAAVFEVGLAGFELKFGAVEFQGYVGRSSAAPAHRVDPGHHGGAALQKIAAVPPRSEGRKIGHQ